MHCLLAARWLPSSAVVAGLMADAALLAGCRTLHSNIMHADEVGMHAAAHACCLQGDAFHCSAAVGDVAARWRRRTLHSVACCGHQAALATLQGGVQQHSLQLQRTGERTLGLLTETEAAW